MQDVRNFRESLDEAKCSCCQQGFFKNVLDQEGRCKVCAERGLVAGSLKQEFEKIKSPEQDRDFVKKLVREIIAELEAEKKAVKEAQKFKQKKCKGCGDTFYPQSPGHTFCETCQEKKQKERDAKN